MSPSLADETGDRPIRILKRVLLFIAIAVFALLIGGLLAFLQTDTNNAWGPQPEPTSDLGARALALLGLCVGAGLVVGYVLVVLRRSRVRRAAIALVILAATYLLLGVIHFDRRFPVDQSLPWRESEAALSNVVIAAIGEATRSGEAPVIEFEVHWDDSVQPDCYSMLGASTDSSYQEVSGRLTPEQVAAIDLDVLAAALAERGYPPWTETGRDPAYRHQIAERDDNSVRVRLETPCLPDP